MPDHTLDRAIDGLARRQHGAFHLRQAVRHGCTRAMRRTRVATGRWVRLADSDVFALPSHPGTWLRQCMAATLSVPAGVIGGPASAALHDVPGWPQAHIDVCTRHGTTHRSPFATVHETRTVGRIVVVEGIRVVSPADTVVQLASRLDTAGLVDLIDAVRPGRRGFLPELQDRYVAVSHSRLPGGSRLGEALERFGDGSTPSMSALERRLEALLASVALPAVQFEAAAPWLDGGEHRVDALIPAWRLVVEADGRAWHSRVRDFEVDRWRDACALANGYATLRLTWHQLTTRPGWCRNVLVAIGRRSGSAGRDPAM